MINIRANLRSVDLFFKRIDAELEDLRPFWRILIDRVIIAEIREVFNSDGRGRWAPRVDSLPHPLLRKSRRMFQSLTDTSHRDNINRQTATSLEFGSDVPYHIIHEEGRGRVPARPVLGFLAEDSQFENDIEKEINNYFQRRIDSLQRSA